MDREQATLSKGDRDALRKLREDTRDQRDPNGYPGVIALKNAEVFPELYGTSRVGGAVPSDGEYWYNKERTTRFVRRKIRMFEGSAPFPEGLVVGVTDIETHRIEGGDEWALRNTQEDISPEEMKRLQCMVEGIPYFSQQSHVQRAQARQKEREALKRQAKNPVEYAAAAGAAAAIEAMKTVQKAVAPPPAPVAVGK